MQACDATAALIGNTLNLALRLPPTMVSQWPVRNLVLETLRYDPPLRTFRRLASIDLELEGHPLSKGAVVTLEFAAANRDSAVFADPHRFDPGRQPAGATLTFGYGLRPCPGAEQALALATGVVEVVLGTCELADPDVPYVPSANLRIPARLEVVARQRLA